MTSAVVLPVDYGQMDDADLERFFLRGRIIVFQVGRFKCWQWTGRVCHRGYGRFWMNGQYRQAHRVMWEYVNERSLRRRRSRRLIDHRTPELDHRCNNRACIRPSHLRPVSHKQNHDLRAQRYFEAKRSRRPRSVRILRPLTPDDELI